MDAVVAIPNHRRPDIGQPPAQLAHRAWLPQHARLCPVLEAGSALGFVVYPPLDEDEVFQIAREDGRFRLTYFRRAQREEWQKVFAMTYRPVTGTIGAFHQELAIAEEHASLSTERVVAICEALVVPGHFDQPAGGVSLRGAHDFRTPAGWDTVYGPVTNDVRGPAIAALTVRVETDWYAHDTEFRYLLAEGHILHIGRASPIGQVFFVPREAPGVREASPDEAAAFRRQMAAFTDEKRRLRQIASTGEAYSPCYHARRKAPRNA